MGSRAGSHESREVTTGVGSHKLGKRQGTYRQSKRGLRRSTLRPCTLDQTHVSCLFLGLSDQVPRNQLRK